MLDALIFDLDDTLYLERDFVMSGYRAVAEHIAGSGICDIDSAFRCMTESFSTRGRQNVFPALIDKFPGISATLPELVEVYRQHSPVIFLFPGYLGLLKEFTSQYRLGVITDGLPAVQARKVRALGLNGIMNKVIYTWTYGADKEKPHPLSFSMMLESLRARPESALFVGDNPEKDCKGAHKAGIKCVQVLHPMISGFMPGSATQDKPDFTINSLLQLPQILRRMN